jgi:glycosyltransferase involved in cell wall biosynthesis
MIFVGPLKQYKHPEVALQVLANLAPDFPNLHLDVIGWSRGGLHQYLFEQATQLGIRSRVTFHGPVSEKEKVELLQRAWVLLQPSEREGWSLAVIEAAACGTPAVATAVGGMRESVKNEVSGLLVPYGDKQALAEATKRVIADTDLRNRLSAEAIKWAQEFSWERYTKEVLDILTGACA